MRAVLLHEPSRPEVTEVPDPAPGPGEVIVAVDACGICGTDLHILDGDFAPTPYPIVPGHEFCGEVVDTGGAADITEGTFAAIDPSLFCGRCRECRRGRGNLCRDWGAIGVTVDGAFAEYVAVPVANVYPLDETIPRSWGTLVEPLSCVVHALDRLGALIGRSALIYGAGTMGLLLAQLVRREGVTRLDVVDPRAERLSVARRVGADGAAPTADDLAASRWDLVVDATGAISAIEDGLGRVARGGTFLVFGVAPADGSARFAPFRICHDEITVIGSMAVLHSFGRAVELLATGAVDPEPLLTHRLPLDAYEDAIARVRAGEGLKVQLSPTKGEAWTSA
ncbi:MAG TPA: alcohol dehydrogenase catalytic domain-containing protein [Actinomycetota bacterium]